MSLPPLILKKNEDRRLRAGHLWVFSNEVDIARTPLKAFTPGDAVTIQSHSGRFIGNGYVNPNSLICARILSRDAAHEPDRSLLVHRLNIALSLRERLYQRLFY
ncbi:MAG: RlmI/RlmK family 23S rRNA methyltransferase, partial [Gammaproteobacteria bacterium]